MIRPATRALAKDALYQVLDNGVFRILAIAALLPVLIFVCVQVTPDEIRLFFGVWSWDLDGIASFAAPEGSADQQAAVLGLLLDLVFFSIAGTFGVLFCLAAASFFVPKMLEKGAVDVLFHKPISRTRFFLSRYATGLLFICLLTLLSATGVFLALILVSGFSDPGVFAVVPALTYLFGLIYPVTMLVGLLTRSTVAALLLSGVFFMLNGVVQQLWIEKEVNSLTRGYSQSEVSGADTTDETYATLNAEAIATLSAEEGPEDGPEESSQEAERDPWRYLFMALDVAHFALPKTSAVPYMTAKLRRATNRSLWSDDNSLLQLGELPDDWSELGSGAPVVGAAGFTALDGNQSFGEPVLGAGGPEGAGMLLYLRPKKSEEVQRANGTTRVKKERLAQATTAVLDSVSATPGITDAQEVSFERKARSRASQFEPQTGTEAETPFLTLPFFASLLTWTEAESQSGAIQVRALVFVNGDQIGTLIHRSSDALPVDDSFREVVGALGYADDDYSYGKLLRFDAGWRTNTAQSIGSSLLFVLLLLGFGCWRLNRYDF